MNLYCRAPQYKMVVNGKHPEDEADKREDFSMRRG